MITGLFTVYRSSAGSGKTYTLVKEYLKIVIAEPERFRNVLAITFTNKAAAEMKGRVIRTCRVISELDGSSSADYPDLLKEIAQEVGLGEQEVIKRAGIVLQLILHHYSDFSITTIDSFVHRVIRTFTFDLKLPTGFEVELDTPKLLSQATDLLISKAGSDDALTKVLVEFSEAQADEEKSFNIEYSIAKLARSTYAMEESGIHLQRLATMELWELMELRKLILMRRKAFEGRVVELASAAVSVLDQNNIENADLARGDSGIGAWFRHLKNGNFEKLTPNSYVRATIENDKWTSTKCSKPTAALIESIKADLITAYEQITQWAEEGLSRYLIQGQLLELFYPLALLNEISRIVNEIRDRESLVLISDFNRIIAEVVTREPVPFLYERLGVRYRHFLLDEFQDTSVMQWHNLIPLIDNGLADGRFSMVVGDGKQAIYRWRNGEVEQFSMLPRIYKRSDDPVSREREAALVRNFIEKPLDRNYRSLPVIIDFNNQLYEFVKDSFSETGRQIYDHHKQEHGTKHSGGYVQIDFPEGEESEGNDGLPNERVLNCIQEIRARGFQRKDIGILCRSNKNANGIATFLMLNGIPVISRESLLLAGAPVVRFLLAVFNVLNNPGDLTSKVAMIRYLNYMQLTPQPDIHTSLDAAGLKRRGDEEKDDSKFDEFLSSCGFVLDTEHLLRLPLYDMTEELIRIFRLNRQADPYVQFFLDAVLDFSSNHDGGLPAFLEWWEEQSTSRSMVIPEGLDAVNIMTVHKSKGLEFPVVILPLEPSGSRNTIERVWVASPDGASELPSALIRIKRELGSTVYSDLYEEETEKTHIDRINLLYVATTRASKSLYVLARQPSDKTETLQDASDILAAFLQRAGLFSDQQHRYVFGEPTEYPSKEPECHEETAVLSSHPWRDRVLLSRKAPLFWDLEAPDRSRDKGMLMHRALAEIIRVEDLDRLPVRLEQRGWADREERDLIRDLIERIKAHEPLMGLLRLEGRVLTETGILTAEGKTYRPDRVCICDDRVVVIDYKTGKPREGHRDQLVHYCGLLKTMETKTVESYLVYLGDSIAVQPVAC